MNYVIITAGGTGKRMGSKMPKQFIEFGGKPILMHSIKKFYDFDKSINIIISLPQNYIQMWTILCNEHLFLIEHKVVAGGDTRFHSIKNALKEIKGDGFIAVHDGVRPLVSNETIKRTFESAYKFGNGIASSEIVFSIRKIENNISVAKNRDLYKEIQTPQTFKISILKNAYLQEYNESFTDDASVVEKFGEKVYLTKGNKENIKITTPFDILIAEAVIRSC